MEPSIIFLETKANNLICVLLAFFFTLKKFTGFSNVKFIFFSLTFCNIFRKIQVFEEVFVRFEILIFKLYCQKNKYDNFKEDNSNELLMLCKMFQLTKK